MKTVVFDIDGVLAEFIGGFYKLLASHWPDQVGKIRYTHHQDSWVIDTPKEIQDKAWKLVKAPETDFWVGLEPLASPSTFNRIDKLTRRYFVTSRIGDNMDVESQSRIWLRKLGIRNPRVHVMEHKKDKADFIYDLGATHVIEDHPQTILDLQKTLGYEKVWKREWRYNEHIKAQSVRSVEEFLDIVEEV